MFICFVRCKDKQICTSYKGICENSIPNDCVLPENYLFLQSKIAIMEFSINLRDGRLVRFDHPVVMGIINLTPDSFFAGSRCLDKDGEEETLLRARIQQMMADGAEMIDVGACSTRPGYEPPSAEEELRRLEWGLPIVTDVVRGAMPISVDTYRASVAEAAVTRLGADIVNDVYGGTRDPEIIEVVNRTGAPFILTADSNDVLGFFAQQIAKVKGAQVILDPGYGFSKTVDDNYVWMRRLSELIEAYPDCPMLVGISRKSMIWKLLGNTPNEALNGTTVLNTIAIQAGAHILRVHDVREAVEAVKIVTKMQTAKP